MYYFARENRFEAGQDEFSPEVFYWKRSIIKNEYLSYMVSG
jgi:hypothetical protein